MRLMTEMTFWKENLRNALRSTKFRLLVKMFGYVKYWLIDAVSSHKQIEFSSITQAMLRHQVQEPNKLDLGH